MTDTTDIKALREIAKKINHRLDVVMGALSPFNPDESAHWDCEKLICDLISQLEAERQRAAGSEEELHKALHREKAAERKLLAAQEEIAALKGEQVPVAWKVTTPSGSIVFHTEEQDMDGHSYYGNTVTPLFTAPQKPVVLPAMQQLKEAVAFYLQVQKDNPPVEQGMHKDADEWLKRAAIEAAGGIVKDGE
ncbi:hypothetical protein [Rahnella inusitata]|uniref:hypothetical protein n=1 Tax=Rahnella inusitata TaxID=58169 RepID=UPI0039BDA79D